jgi:acyl-CoA reductase-like NAD-dependent aldehyde dehydrogenase
VATTLYIFGKCRLGLSISQQKALQKQQKRLEREQRRRPKGQRTSQVRQLGRDYTSDKAEGAKEAIKETGKTEEDKEKNEAVRDMAQGVTE